jgi:hypothetical protein
MYPLNDPRSNLIARMFTRDNFCSAQQLVDIDEQLDDQLHRIDLVERTLIVGEQRLDEGALNLMVPACARRSPPTINAPAAHGCAAATRRHVVVSVKSPSPPRLNATHVT